MATKTTSAARSTSVPAIEKKALAESNKSEGMRMLFDDGYTVTQVRKVFSAPYGYVYGVALRHGVIDSAANRRAPRATKAVAKKTQTKVAANRAPKSVQATKKSPARQLAAPAPRARKAKAAPATKPGRPTAARRAANRKPAATIAKA